MKKIVYILIIIMAIFGCAKESSENVNQDSIYSIYELFYNKTTDKTTAKATYRLGGFTGTMLELNTPAYCTFNNDTLLYNSVSGMHVLEYAGRVDSGVYVYQDLDNNVFTNHASAIDTIAFSDIDTINTANAFTFEWIGEPVKENETITLTIDGTQQNNFEVFTNITQNSSSMVLAANRLQNLGEGIATCTLQRLYTNMSIEEGTSKGGRMAISYSLKKSIYIKN